MLVQISVNRLLPQAPRLSSPLFITVKVYGFYCGQITAARGRHRFLSFPSLCWGPLVFMPFIVQSQGLYPELPNLMRLMYQIKQHTHKHGHILRGGEKKKSMFCCLHLYGFCLLMACSRETKCKKRQVVARRSGYSHGTDLAILSSY